MQEYSNWIASAATMIAAMMTAANLGTKVTGWGFVLFTIGSVAWSVVGFLTDQFSLLFTNAFLLVVNAFGVWRWLGRQAQHEQASAVAVKRSRNARHLPTLFSGSWLNSASITDRNGETIGTVVDTMLALDTKRLSYVVISQGGIGGGDATLRAINPQHLTIGTDCVSVNLTSAEIAALPAIDEGAWPVAAPEPSTIPPEQGTRHAQDQNFGQA